MCECAENVNATLRAVNPELNTKVCYNLLEPHQVSLLTIKVDNAKRGKPKPMVASFCPFCGAKYAHKGV